MAGRYTEPAAAVRDREKNYVRGGGRNSADIIGQKGVPPRT
jgi:hypothetical protein